MTATDISRDVTADDIEVISFGCRLNAYESEAIKNLARGSGLENAVIVNTCAVTAEAERQARQAIRGAKRKRPHSRIIVTGCAAQVNPQNFADMGEVDLVLGNIEKLERASYRNAFTADTPKIAVNDIMSVRETAGHLVPGFEDRARAFVQVQQGCDHRCTFCIIPFGRGNSRSVPMGEIAAQAKMLVKNGYREIVLTGVDISSFGGDLPGAPSLGQMVRRLLSNVPGIERLRLSSIDPAEIDEDLLALFANEERLMPHLHLSLQSGDDMILKRMKRRHSRSQAIELCARLRQLRPGIVFGADVIAGFPTESEPMFENSVAMINECDLVWLHVFPYSPRPGTPASRMPRVHPGTVKARAAKLRAAADDARIRYFRSRIGTRAQVLVEREDFGRSEHFAPVRLATPGLPGMVVPAEITSANSDELLGEIAR